jgi:hypothetical protein
LSGSFELKSGIIGLVSDDYKMSAVVQKGSSELIFTPAVNLIGSTLRVRGISGIQSIGVSFDADYQAVLDYATTQGYTLPSAGQQLLQNQLVVDLKDRGIWNTLDLMYLFATNGDSDFATINFKNANNFQLIKVNSPTFTTNVGFTGDGSTAKLSTANGGNEYNLLNDAINPTVNSVTSLGYFNNLGSMISYLFGSLQLTPFITGHHFGRQAATRVNSTLNTPTTPLTNFLGVRRNTSSSFDLIDGSTITNIGQDSVNFPNQTLGILGRDGSPSSFSNAQISFFTHGASLTDTEIADVKTIIETYLTAI